MRAMQTADIERMRGGIWWDEGEKKAFMDLVVDVVRNEPAISRRIAIIKAMARVPESRRRNIVSLTQVKAKDWQPPEDLAEFFVPQLQVHLREVPKAPKTNGAAHTNGATTALEDDPSLPPIPDPSLSGRERQSAWMRRNAAIKRLARAAGEPLKTMVKLKRDERELVAKWAAQHLMAHEGTAPITLTDAYRLAQQQLPEGRRSETLMPKWVSPMVEVELAALKKRLAEAPPPPMPSAEEMRAEPVEQIAIPEPVPATSEPWAGLAAQIAGHLSTFLAGVLVDAGKKFLTRPEVARAVTSFQLGRLPSIIREVVPEAAPVARHNPVAHSPHKGQRLTVLVCGMMGHQRDSFIKAFPDLHLKFWFQEVAAERLEQLRAKAAGADVVVFKVEQTSHSATQIVKNMGKKLVLVSGGVEAMLEAVRNERARYISDRTAVPA